MIVSIEKVDRKNAFKLGPNIAFAISLDGDYANSFAEEVSKNFWPKLTNIGPKSLGTVLVCKIEGRVLSSDIIKPKIMKLNLFGLVCRQNYNSNWQTLTECLNLIKLPLNQYLVLVADNSGNNSEYLISMLQTTRHCIVLATL